MLRRPKQMETRARMGGPFGMLAIARVQTKSRGVECSCSGLVSACSVLHENAAPAKEGPFRPIRAERRGAMKRRCSSRGCRGGGFVGHSEEASRRAPSTPLLGTWRAGVLMCVRKFRGGDVRCDGGLILPGPSTLRGRAADGDVLLAGERYETVGSVATPEERRRIDDEPVHAGPYRLDTRPASGAH